VFLRSCRPTSGTTGPYLRLPVRTAQPIRRAAIVAFGAASGTTPERSRQTGRPRGLGAGPTEIKVSAKEMFRGRAGRESTTSGVGFPQGRVDFATPGGSPAFFMPKVGLLGRRFSPRHPPAPAVISSGRSRRRRASTWPLPSQTGPLIVGQAVESRGPTSPHDREGRRIRCSRVSIVGAGPGRRKLRGCPAAPHGEETILRCSTGAHPRGACDGRKVCAVGRPIRASEIRIGRQNKRPRASHGRITRGSQNLAKRGLGSARAPRRSSWRARGRATFPGRGEIPRFCTSALHGWRARWGGVGETPFQKLGAARRATSPRTRRAAGRGGEGD